MIRSLVTAFLFAGTVVAQTNPAPIPMPLPGPFEPLIEQMTVDQLAEAHRLAIEFTLRENENRMKEFAAAWNAYVVEYTEKRAVNRRKAKAVHHAWSRVENVIPR